jgi:protein-S-isoprenylcysteine O-methyltransferase Ste14
VTDDPAQLARQSAYLDSMRAQGRPARFAGFIACLLGVLVLVLGRFRLGGPPWMLWTGVAIVGLGWALFIYAVVRRLAWIRTHPFDPNVPEPHG